MKRTSTTTRNIPTLAFLRGAQAALAQGDAMLALERSEALVAQDPQHLPALELLAKALWQIGDLPRLLGVLDGMIKLNPYEPGYFELQGAALQSLGRVGEAVRALERGITLAKRPTAEAVAMLEELRRYQDEMVAGLLATDTTFKTHFAQDPLAAARSRGFELDRAVVQRRVQINTPRALFLAARPS